MRWTDRKTIIDRKTIMEILGHGRPYDDLPEIDDDDVRRVILECGPRLGVVRATAILARGGSRREVLLSFEGATTNDSYSPPTAAKFFVYVRFVSGTDRRRGVFISVPVPDWPDYVIDEPEPHEIAVRTRRAGMDFKATRVVLPDADDRERRCAERQAIEELLHHMRELKEST